jgi:sulfate permease, SulP family
MLLVSIRLSQAAAAGPLTRNWPMWEMSKIPALVRTAVCSSMIEEYCTGMFHPAKGTRRAPSARWAPSKRRAFQIGLVSALGGSRVQIGGPTAAFIPIILLIIERHGFAGLIMATLMAGVILIIMGLARMGSLIKFIPWPVTSGFTTGIAVAIIATQSGEFLGIHTRDAAPREFTERLHWLMVHFKDIHLPTLILAAGCLMLIVLWPRLGLKRIPGSIVAMLGATALVAATGWQETLGISTIGSKFGQAAIPAGLPAWVWPDIHWAMVRDLIGPATAIALLGAIESLLSAVVADGLTNQRHDSNTELIAQGIANLVCPFFGGLPVTGAIARTSANVNNGGRSPVAGIVHALTLLVIVLLFSRLAVHVPLAAMSAVLVFVAIRMGEWHELRRLRRMPVSDAVVLLTTFALTRTKAAWRNW